MLNLIDELARERLAIWVDRKMNPSGVIDVLSDHGPDFMAKAVWERIAAVGAFPPFIEPGSPWENRCCESLHSKLRDGLLNGEIFCSLAEARTVIEVWRRHDNTSRPHSFLAYRPPAPDVGNGRLRSAPRPPIVAPRSVMT